MRLQDAQAYGRVVEAQERAWAEKRAAYVPEQWRKRILSEWSERRAADEFGGNTWLRELAADMRQGGALGLDATDAEIRAAARDAAASLYELAAALPVKTLAGIRAGLEDATRAHGINPPAADCTDEGACARMLQSDWWVRRMRAAHGRRIEYHAVGLGYVHKRAGCYVSDMNLKRRREQRARNAKALEAVTLVNQYDDEYTLAALAEKSNANPVIRRNELMTRISGFEAVAKGLGHAAEFWTGTCPSRFHAVHFGGARNTKFEGATAREAQEHLVKAWAKCRAAMGRRGIRPYGFRIAEPHHDGCPHWHLLLFMPADQVEGARALFRRYFLDEHDATERGAQENRVKFVKIDPARGSAAGYVAKYVAKNIDGYKLGSDLWGNDEVTTAERVDAWASTWGIRQFQQIGGAPVTTWRELRRIPKDEKMGPTADAARDAADAGDWAEYLRVMGGPMVERKSLPLRTAYTAPGERFDPVESMPKDATNCYGEPAAPAVFGIEDAWGARYLSRRFRWEKRWGGRDAKAILADCEGRGTRTNAAETVAGARKEDGDFCAAADAREIARGRGGEGAQGVRVSGLGRAQRGPWTRVNNCTQGGEGGNDGSATNGGFGERASRNQGAGGHQSGAFVGQIDGGEGIATARGGAGGHLAGAARHHVRSRAHERGGLTDGE